MHLRAQNAGPSVRSRLPVTREWVRTMTYRKLFVASLSAVALVLAANEAFAASAHGASGHRSVGALRHHHRGSQIGTYWPGIGDDSSYGPSSGEPPVDFAQPTPRDSYASDVPWDWAHRYPPVVTTPGLHPYVPDCHAQTVKVPGGGGEDHAVNILRCY